jgi:hypothetical protein
MPVPYQLISHDAQQALTEFSEAFDAALAVAPPETWAMQLGYHHQSNSVKTTFPIPLSQAGFRERLGDDKLRALYEKSLSIIPREWYDGVKAPSRVVEAPDFIGWTSEPARIANEWLRHPNTITAEMLHDNPLLDLYRIERPGGSTASAVTLFSASHPVNIGVPELGTFDNDIAGSVNEALITALKLYFRTLPGPNGKPMGLRLGSLLVPAALEEQFRDLLELDVVVRAIENQAGSDNVGGVAVNNRHKGTVGLVVGDELEDANLVYALAVTSTGAPGPAPWVLQTTGAPEEIRYDKDSELWKDTGDVAVKYVGLAGVAAALPHGIVRVTIS